ncbi:MAG: hypothetical protein UHT63_00425 [Acutalibacteraceae bacterium]|nr:hypothetical protein [Acutalibacteraceae bacterium]
MRRKPHCKKDRAPIVFAFGLGIIIATFLPYKAMMLILGIVLILLGCAYAKCR